MWNKISLIILSLFAFAVSLDAHPLGNFTVSNYSRIELEKNQIHLRCVLDMAEIAAFQESQQIDADKNKVLSSEELGAYLEKLTPEYLANLKLFIDDQPVQIQTAAKNISLPPGAGNLPTLRVEWDFAAEIPAGAASAIRRLRFENANYKERLGWNEIVINRAAGINVFDSSAFGSALTDELKAYPEDMLSAPLTERAAELSFTGGATVPADAKALQNRNGSASAPVQKDSLADLISVREITPAIVLFGLALAFGLGAMHAMSPGHGKTVVGAYLVGSKGTVKHAAFLGLTVTITHTLGVFALGLITLFATQFILPERIMPFLSFVSGLLVLFIGLTLFKERLVSALGYKTTHHHHDHGDAHEHGHEHGDEHHHHDHHGALVHTHDGQTHSHLPPEAVTWKSLLALGISGGLLPCPSALVLMLAAINLNRVGYGLLLTLAFSFGLAATLMCVGLAFLYLGKLLDRPSIGSNPIVKALPVFSAMVIAGVGAVICYNSL
ncbi:MAG TPA: sulfite exporter TauE/SafE family protein [Pyrinomonadaceae bacterium]|jgi:ABC-type nickel/cobalt efflux system permease component RcnA